MKRIGFAACTAIVLLLSVAPSASASAPATSTSVRALKWIHAQQRGDGSIAGDPSRTEDVILGLVANRFSVAVFTTGGKGPLDFLRSNIANEEATAGNIASLVLAVIASGGAPASFAGHNLPDDLGKTYGSTTPGEYGSDIFGDALAILAARAASLTVPAAAVQFLEDHQNKNASDAANLGGWSSDNAGSFGSDTNTTSLALQAIAAVGPVDTLVRTSALAYLRRQQQPSGGFQFQAGAGGSDPNSDGLVIEGLLSVGQDPTSPTWSRTKNAVTDLQSFQVCDGSFSFPGLGPDNLFATTQPLVALASTFLPVRPSSGSADVLTQVAPTPLSCAPQPPAASQPTQKLAQTGGSQAVPFLFGLSILLVGILAWRRPKRA